MTDELGAASRQMQDEGLREIIREELHGAGKSTKARFDGTVNLGHLLTMATMLGTLVMGWSTLDKRLSLVEAQMMRQTEVIDRSIRTDEQLRSIRERLDKMERAR
ncbi:hypothetical protein V5F44_21080 [Xanthobacter sp. V2C-8]|uniref:hypothetical protein n=1 Tax=Xanthobacter albus TaxID=3119929 RepID=UPI00372B446B